MLAHKDVLNAECEFFKLVKGPPKKQKHSAHNVVLE